MASDLQDRAVLFQRRATEANSCAICVFDPAAALLPCSDGVGRRRAAHLRGGGHGHRQPPVHGRRVHPHDVPARQGHGKYGRTKPCQTSKLLPY